MLLLFYSTVDVTQLSLIFFKNLKIPFAWEQFEHPQDSTKALIKKIDKNVPILIQTDIYYLPYFNSSTHFPGHAVVVWGYDDSEMIFSYQIQKKRIYLKWALKTFNMQCFLKAFSMVRETNLAQNKLLLERI